jgi:hypothetical protein
MLVKNYSIHGQHTRGTETHKILDEANNAQRVFFKTVVEPNQHQIMNSFQQDIKPQNQANNTPLAAFFKSI